MSAYDEGVKAFLDGKPQSENPYKSVISWEGLEWSQGWYDAATRYEG